MWEIFENSNFDPKNPDVEPEFYVCNEETCLAAYDEDEAKWLLKILNSPLKRSLLDPVLIQRPRPPKPPEPLEPKM
ncbi:MULTISPECIES: hypothetical protein [Desulfovibrio]|uniref:hypothetical protein n=1 Tax=Desulfovibrio TaxID=872 RepID=UPI001160328F|nr:MULTISPECIES: hypothetical protein [Desulfovibrio]